MNRLAVLLAAATLIFTATAVHYARELKLQQARNQQAGGAFPAAAHAQNGQAGASADVDGLPANAGLTDDGAAAGSDASGPKSPDPAMLALARHRLDQLNDSTARAERAREIADGYRATWQEIAKHIDLPAQEMEQLLAQFADRTLARQQRRLECQLEPGCDVRAINAANSKAARLEQAELLRPEVYERYRMYMDAGRERAQVASLGWRLTGDDVLSDAKRETLTMALAEERRRFVAETGQERPQGIEYDQRLYQRASTLLNAAQLTEFRDLQQRFQKEREIRESARKAAGDAR